MNSHALSNTLEIILISGILTASFAATATSFIVENGEPNAQIVIAEKPTRTQKLAASELQKYVKKISGAELPITSKPANKPPVKIYVGASAFTKKMGLDNQDLDNGAYQMKSGKDYLVLLGRDTDYRRDNPYDGGVYPANRGDRKRANEEWKKKHGEKWSSPFMSSFKSYNKKLGIWSVDERGSLNAVNDFLRSLGVRWFMPGDFGEVCPKMASIPLPDVDETVRPEVGYRHMGFYWNAPFMASPEELLWQLRLGLNQKGNIGGHGIMYMLGPEKVKKENPDFFALYNGKRDTEHRGGHPCHSSEGLLKSSVEFAQMMGDEYDRDVISLMPTDGYSYFCQCEDCVGKDTPERGTKGVMSDYVWDFVNRGGAELAKTRPDMKVSCYAYSTYLLPPEKIDKLNPNVAVGVCQHRSNFGDPKEKETYRSIRDGWIEKIPSGKIHIWEYYLHGRPKGAWDGVPVYFPRLIAEDMKNLKGRINGEGIEVVRGSCSLNGDAPDPVLATNHLNCYVTSRLWWDPDQNLDELLDDYYKKFYGPAAEEMKAFVEFCENNWRDMIKKHEPIDQAFALLEKAKKAAGDNTIHAKRVQLIADYMKPLRELRDKLKIGRKNNPVAQFGERDKGDVKLDGKLDEPFWKDLPTYELKDLKTGGDVKNKTTFKVALVGDSLVFGVRCQDEDMKNLNAPATKTDDMLVFSGDSLEILLETPTHSYYQIAIDPKGNVVDVDRIRGVEIKWGGGLEVATANGDDAWTAEVKIPFLGSSQEELNPEFGVSGDRPAADGPWYFNVCRLRKREGDVETSAFSPTMTSGFHNVMKFAKLTPKTGINNMKE